jgi:CIC family chloride channel protein
MPLKEIQQTITERKLRTFPVLNETGELCGVISLSDVQAALKKGPLSQDASDIATKSMVTVAENENLFSALSKITLGDFAMLPVVDPGGPKKLLGVISRRDIMAAIGHAVVGQGGV